MPRSGESLRIAMISYYLPSGSKIGVGYQVHAMANGLVRRGHDVTVISDCEASAGSEYKTQTLNLVGRMRTFRFAAAIRGLDLSSYDVLHAHGDDYWLWRKRVPAHVRTLHGSCLSEALRIGGAKEKIRMTALGLSEELATIVADRTVVVSPHTRRWVPWVRQVVPNGIDTDVFHPETSKTAHPTILFVGTFHRRKRGWLLMDAFERFVRPRFPGAKLIMVCEDAPEAPGVVRMGRIDEETLVELYQQAWVFCLPSSYEGFGIPYAEALSCGTPVVATSNPGSRYVLDHGRAGIITRSELLGSALIEILGDARERERLRAVGLQRARHFSMSGVLDLYEEIYRSLLAR